MLYNRELPSLCLDYYYWWLFLYFKGKIYCLCLGIVLSIYKHYFSSHKNSEIELLSPFYIREYWSTEAKNLLPFKGGKWQSGDWKLGFESQLPGFRVPYAVLPFDVFNRERAQKYKVKAEWCVQCELIYTKFMLVVTFGWGWWRREI